MMPFLFLVSFFLSLLRPSSLSAPHFALLCFLSVLVIFLEMLSHRFRRHSCIIGSHTEGHDRWTFDCVDCFAGFFVSPF